MSVYTLVFVIGTIKAPQFLIAIQEKQVRLLTIRQIDECGMQFFEEDAGVLASKTPFMKSAASKTVPIECQEFDELIVGCHNEVLH